MKTKHILLGLVFTILSITIITSCKKYEDGPWISIRTKQTRLTGDWKIQSVTLNGVDQSANYSSNFEWDIEDNETYTIKAAPSGTTTTEISGKWKFGEDKDDVYFTDAATGIETSFRITRLKMTELWFYYIYPNGDKLAFKLKQ